MSRRGPVAVAKSFSFLRRTTLYNGPMTAKTKKFLFHSLRSTARGSLERVVNRPRFNDSRIYQAYLALVHPRHFRRKQAEAQFYGRLIREAGGGMIFDVGASFGEKAAIFVKFADTVVAIEPSPEACLKLRERFRDNAKVTVVQAGVGAIEGNAQFHQFHAGDCYNTFSKKWTETLAVPDPYGRPLRSVESVVEVPMVTLSYLFEKYGPPNYLKIDVEGYEIEVLKGLQQPLPLVSFESNLPVFLEETLDGITRLDRLHPKATFNFSALEPPTAFISDRWISAEEMRAHVRNGKFPFMEIFCRP